MTELELMLCNACLTKTEENPNILVAEFCNRCKQRVYQWLIDTAEEYERLSDE
jgi:hypothetical protein